jgi:hypothetical protein
MSTVMIVLNIVFVTGVVAVIVGGLLYAVATQHHDHDVAASGPLFRRHVWSPRRRPQPGRTRQWPARQGQAWPTA